MGFYGNITNTSKTTFSFDLIYTTRSEMDLNANIDGEYIISKMTIPLAYNGTMSITGTKVVQRLY